MKVEIDSLDPKSYIVIKGARVNNLKDLSVGIPRDQLVVITGLSGSGKSSLAFDTLFAEGQRKYVESLSSYARQFLGRMEKPEVEYIKGVAPAISIEQKVNTRNPRSTVGTTTEIYDYMKLLFARIGITYSPDSGKKVQKDTVTDVVDYVMQLGADHKVMIACPLIVKRPVRDELKILLSKGYTRVMVDEKPRRIEELLEGETKPKSLDVLIDRLVVQQDEDTEFRLSDSVQTAFFEGEGTCIVYGESSKKGFSDLFESEGMRFEEPSVNFFTFNNPYGACRTCEGFGQILGIDPDLVIPDRNLSVHEGAIAPWRSETMTRWLEPLLKKGILWGFPIHRAIAELSEEEYQLLWGGKEDFKGLNEYFAYLTAKTHKIQYRVMLSRYRGKTVCPDCRGTRLRKDAGYVKINGHSITDLVLLPISALSEFFDHLSLTAYEEKVAGRILAEIRNRLSYMAQVGLTYLTLNRLTNTLSGGEFQRIKLATSLGSALVGSMYILDEPSIGLHPRDTQQLIGVLKHLRDLGNSVLVVEHEEEVIRAADQIIDIGPDAGIHGGELVFQGSFANLAGSASHTAKYLTGGERIPVPPRRRGFNERLEIIGARENNLKNIDVSIPLGVLTVITGVSGSGKSTLVRKILHPALSKQLGMGGGSTGKHTTISGDYQRVTQVEYVDQNPIGKSSRSNPVTYVKAYDGIRQLFAEQEISKKNGFKPAHFSFNVDGGRCETCDGEGTVKIEMQFMADIHLPCESCKGARFKKEILEVKYQGLNIAEVLDLSIDEAMTFFKEKGPIVNRLEPLFDVGLGYVKLGQSSSTLSGGEAQRVKLASFLGKNAQGQKGHILFIFDEPTTGLHIHDIRKLLEALNALVDQGHSLVIIEHNTEMIKCADWIIDLGPEGGDGGGYICFEGTPEQLVNLDHNHTADFLKGKL